VGRLRFCFLGFEFCSYWVSASSPRPPSLLAGLPPLGYTLAHLSPAVQFRPSRPERFAFVPITLHIIIIPGWAECAEKYSAPPGSAEHEIEQFWRMEMVDMVIQEFGFLVENREV
jgi:hypothetical protein